jgi:hypothetical protein
MITLTLDKIAPVKAGFSIKDLVHQGPRQSTLRQIVRPEGFAPSRKEVQGYADLYSRMGRDETSQEALYPHLSAIVHRPVQVAA